MTRIAHTTLDSETGYACVIHAGRHQLTADESTARGGTDTGPAPYQLLLSGLAACTAITLRMVAARKGWKLGSIHVDDAGAVLGIRRRGDGEVGKADPRSRNPRRLESEEHAMRIAPGLPCLIAAFAWSSQLLAQAYPGKPIRIIVPYSAGGGTDIVARAVGQKLSEAWGQSVIVDNRAGASGMIGAEAVAKAPADGYTLLMATPPEVAVNHHLYGKVSYNPERDFAPITLVAVTPLVIAVHPDVRARNIQELVALARAKPGTLAYATPGTGSTQHLTAEMLMAAAHIQLVHIPYKGAGQSIPDVMGGQVPLGIYGLLTINQQAKAGRLRVLAVTTLKRASTAQDLPTLAESGFPGFDTSLWFGLLAPAATPKGVIGRVHAEVLRALKKPEVVERIASQGADIVGSSPAEFAAFIASESAKYARIIKQAGVKLD